MPAASMPEIMPRITYSPEGELEVNTCFYDDPVIRQKQEQYLESLEDRWLADVDETETDVCISLDVERSLGDHFGWGGNRQELTDFLVTLRALLPFEPGGSIDHVVGLQGLSSHGATALIYPQFQRWLDAKGLEEETARRVIESMALPFGAEYVQKASRDFRHYGSFASAHALNVAVMSKESDFGNFRVEKIEETEESFIEKSGSARWSWVDLHTRGECACWGVNGNERERLHLSSSPRLYKMTPHNIDMPMQSLSLVLGIGAMAHKASGYEGEEDVLADVNWQERVFAKDGLHATLLRRRQERS